LLYMNQLAREVWWHEAPRLVAAAGWLAEPAYLQAYRRTSAVTISRSTLTDLRQLGLRRPITVVPMAFDSEIVDEPRRRQLTGQLVAIGRLTPSKRYDHAIEAIAYLRDTHPHVHLTLVGEGRDRERLLKHATTLGVAGSVTLAGRLTESEKVAILDEADVLVGTSAREGWGLTVTEAAARGIPSVVYDVAGFRDAVVSGRTGLACEPTPRDLADAVRRLLDDRALYDQLSAGALRAVSRLGWDATAHGFLAAIEAVASGQRTPRRKVWRRATV
jgi:glycosyltransferase involved in cell wall biosynthesis